MPVIKKLKQDKTAKSQETIVSEYGVLSGNETNDENEEDNGGVDIMESGMKPLQQTISDYTLPDLSTSSNCENLFWNVAQSIPTRGYMRDAEKRQSWQKIYGAIIAVLKLATAHKITFEDAKGTISFALKKILNSMHLLCTGGEKEKWKENYASVITFVNGIDSLNKLRDFFETAGEGTFVEAMGSICTVAADTLLDMLRAINQNWNNYKSIDEYLDFCRDYNNK